MSRSRSSGSSRRDSRTLGSTRAPTTRRCGSASAHGDRVVIVRDYGTGFDEPEGSAGQGLKNMRQRAASIGGAFRIVSTPGRGTSLEVVLRA